MPRPETTDYRLATPWAVRICGSYVVAWAVVVLVATVVAAAVGTGPAGVVAGVAVAGAVGLAVLWWWLRRRAYVVRCDAAGYRVGLLRGAGVRSAEWREVAEAVASRPHGVACLELRLRDGRRTALPVAALAVDRDRLVRDVQRRLDRGHGLRRVGRPGG